ncbi:jg3341 [Pararge aegeria aegeria]|uniref:Jg3341 protein n=1 Tax=Pararge aegeria aegeria TaxID=348720 RepID=A0A8S4RTU0_9NEOP|nr:jg3341 [Pararge aegeria aegeria]
MDVPKERLTVHLCTLPQGAAAPTLGSPDVEFILRTQNCNAQFELFRTNYVYGIRIVASRRLTLEIALYSPLHLSHSPVPTHLHIVLLGLAYLLNYIDLGITLGEGEAKTIVNVGKGFNG